MSCLVIVTCHIISCVLQVEDPYESVHQMPAVSVSRMFAVSSNYSHFHIIRSVYPVRQIIEVFRLTVEKYVGSDQFHKSVITNPVLIIQCSESTYPIKAYLNRF